jgi:hypothetical protein
MVYKLMMSAQKKWRLLNGSSLLSDVLQGIKFIDGERETKNAALFKVPHPQHLTISPLACLRDTRLATYAMSSALASLKLWAASKSSATLPEAIPAATCPRVNDWLRITDAKRRKSLKSST